MPKPRFALAVCVQLLAAGCAARGPAHEFPVFWREFREAALAGDVDRLAAMTRFPLEVRGPDDADPVQRRGREAFAGTVARVMQQDAGEQPRPETVRQFFERTREVPPQPDGARGTARVGDFVFERTGGRWRLVRIYLADTP